MNNNNNNNNNTVECRDLTRYFGRTCAVDSLWLDIPKSSVTALLGRNGSGKTTLIRMILGLLAPNRGSSSILGHDSTRIPPAERSRIGYIAENHPLIDWMTIRQLEQFQRSFFAKWNDRLFNAIIDHFRLTPDSKPNHLSRGERAGVSLALALAPEPEVLIMDDPALGLDPVARRSLLESIILLTRDEGRTILFSSHLLGDVERVADRVAILDRSVLRMSCSVDEFRQRIRQWIFRFDGKVPPLPKLANLLHARIEDSAWRLTLENQPEPDDLLRQLGAASAQESPISLEDAVIAYLGERGHASSLLAEAGVAS